MLTRRRLLLLATLLTPACSGGACLYSAPTAPAWAMRKDTDGKTYKVVSRGSQRTWYDGEKIHKVELDTNADGKPDLVAIHDGAPRPKELQIDMDYDGTPDRWEILDEKGALVKVGVGPAGKPQRWMFPAPDGLPARLEYDADGDGRPERIERMELGRAVEIEVDSDRDGRMDRWQHFVGRRLSTEDLDTDADGKPDRRLVYDEKGALKSLQKLD